MLSSLLSEHLQYLNDAVRNDAYCRAVKEVLRPGDVAIDLGSGTGILGLICARAGAGRVIAVDRSEMIEASQTAFRDNGYSDISEHHHLPSSELSLPERADGVIADQASCIGVFAGLIESFFDARERLLKPGGWLIPSHLSMVAALVSAPDQWQQVDFWNNQHCGFTFKGLAQPAANSPYVVDFAKGGGEIVSAPVPIARVELGSGEGDIVATRIELAPQVRGVIHGLSCWFVVQLSPSVTITNSPIAETRIDREQIYLPFSPYEVGPEDRVLVDLRVSVRSRMISWNVSLQDSAGSQSSVEKHSTFFSRLVPRRAWAALHPDFIPSPTALGLARLTVLNLCAGRHRLADIEERVFEEHADVFRSRSEADAFVTEVLARNCQPADGRR